MQLQLKPLVWSRHLKFLFAGFIFVGTLAFLVGLGVDATRAWANFLFQYYFWFCIGLSGVFFVALQHVSRSSWSTPLRRIAEGFAAYLPVALILLVVLFFGLHTLYEWTHTEVVKTDPILSQKAVYLNIPFFMGRVAAFLGIAMLAGWLMIRNSLRQDSSGDIALTKRNATIAAPFLVIFAFTFSFVSFDLMMSLSPHWFSTIFGIYCWAILFVGGVSLLTMTVILLRKTGHLEGIINENHYHDLGKLLFAFLVFWTYIAFSQFMLIYYANLPEETPYMIVRTSDGWKKFSIALMFIKFFIPFFLLVSRAAKRNEKILFFGALWLFVAQLVDVYWLVFPTFFERPLFGWMEIGVFLGFIGLFFLSVGSFLTRVPIVAKNDPLLYEGLHFHQ